MYKNCIHSWKKQKKCKKFFFRCLCKMSFVYSNIEKFLKTPFLENTMALFLCRNNALLYTNYEESHSMLLSKKEEAAYRTLITG